MAVADARGVVGEADAGPTDRADPQVVPCRETQQVNHIGQRVVQSRLAAGLSQAGLARRTGLSQSTLSTIEGGASNPRADTLRLLADALGVTVASFFGESVVTGLADFEPEDAAFIEAFRRAPVAVREDVRAYLDFAQSRLRTTASGRAPASFNARHPTARTVPGSIPSQRAPQAT